MNQPRVAHRSEPFSHGSVSLDMVMPACADELIDEEAFARDERLPYWADLWPASLALSKWLIDNPPAANLRIIELGCGMALPSLTLTSLGRNILATDWEPDALDNVRSNALHNKLREIPSLVLDWRSPPAELEPFDLALGADLMYEERNAIALAELLPRILKPTGSYLLADPGRRWLPQFQLLMTKRNWRETELAQLQETQTLSTGPHTSTIRIIRFDHA